MFRLTTVAESEIPLTSKPFTVGGSKVLTHKYGDAEVRWFLGSGDTTAFKNVDRVNQINKVHDTDYLLSEIHDTLSGSDGIRNDVPNPEKIYSSKYRIDNIAPNGIPHVRIRRSAAGEVRDTGTAGRTRAFFTFHVPPPKIATVPSSTFSGSSRTPLQFASSGNKQTAHDNISLSERLAKILDPRKSTINIFVYDQPKNTRFSRQLRTPVISKASFKNARKITQPQTLYRFSKYRPYFHKNKVNNEENILKSQSIDIGNVNTPSSSIQKGRLVFSKRVKVVPDVIKQLMNNKENVRESTLLHEKTMHLESGPTNLINQNSKSVVTKPPISINLNQRQFLRSPRQNPFNYNQHIASTRHAFNNNKFTQPSVPWQNSLPISTSFVKSNIQFNPPVKLEPARAVSLPTISAAALKSSPSPTPTFQASQGQRPQTVGKVEDNNNNNRDLLQQRPQKPTLPPQKKKLSSFTSRPKLVPITVPRHASSGSGVLSSLPTGQPLSHTGFSSSLSSTTSGGRAQESSSPIKRHSFVQSPAYCGMCEKYDQVTGGCEFDPCCPLKLAGFKGISC